MIEKLYEAIEHYGRYYRIYEMFESHTGWLWFTREMFSNQPAILSLRWNWLISGWSMY
jgi:hypothetical protein